MMIESGTSSRRRSGSTVKVALADTWIPAFAAMTALILLIFSMLPFQARAAQSEFTYQEFAQIPVLHEGRIKPLDTFARSFLTGFHGKTAVEGQEAIAWLAELLFDQGNAYQRRVFNIANPDVAAAINLSTREGHRYTFGEVSRAIFPQQKMILALARKDEKERSKAQNQLVELYLKTLWYTEISRSVSLILPEFSVQSEEVAEQMGVPASAPFNYMTMMQSRPAYLELVQGIEGKEEADLTRVDMELLDIGFALRRMDADRQSQILRIVPPAWAEDEDAWFSPWGIFEAGRGSPQSVAYLNLWEKMATAYISGNPEAWKESVAKTKAFIFEKADESVNEARLTAEYFYNTVDAFKLSLMLYVAAFVSLMISGLLWKRGFSILAISLIAGGFALHVAGIMMRIYIMGRPPVATLYESIIFVGAVAVIFGLIMAWRGRDNTGLMIAALLGACLQFVGMRYSAEGDSMGMLVAVLNTNFWLATHVVTITIGYGCCFVTGILGHLWLLQKVKAPDDRDRLGALSRNMLAASLVALFFSVLGTILGGIWADQSWGRFWGWDPKENGAMLICLWLLFLIHGRLSGMVTTYGFAVGAVITNIVVSLAWFGVNLLNVGLHSYGFTSNIALNLAAFAGFELLFIAIVWIILKARDDRKAAA